MLVQNAVSNKRNELVQLRQEKLKYISAQQIIVNENKKLKRDPRDKYQVETIILDDIIPYLPKQDDGTEFKSAAMKIDVEGFEPFVLQNASKLFDHLDVRIILMEWEIVSMGRTVELKEEMIRFLTSRGFKPTYFDSVLDTSDTVYWPFNVLWINERERLLETNF